MSMPNSASTDGGTRYGKNGTAMMWMSRGMCDSLARDADFGFGQLGICIFFATHSDD